MAASSHPLAAEFKSGRRSEALRNYVLPIFIFVVAVWLAVSGVQLVSRILHYYCAIPVWDYWRTAENLHSYQRLHIGALWRQHNEHRIIFPEMVFALDMLLLHGRQILPTTVSIVCYVLTFGILACSVCAARGVAGIAKITGVCLAGIVMFWQGAAFPLATSFLLQWTLLQLCVVCALFFLCSLARTGSDKYLLFVIIAGGVGTYSSGNGLVLWIILIAGGWLLKLDSKRLGILVAAGILCDGLYFIGYRFSHDSHPLYLLEHPLYLLKFAAAYIGMPFSKIGGESNHRAPVIGICCGLFNLLSVFTLAVVSARRKMLRLRPAVILFGSYGFTLLTLLITAVGRMDPNDPAVQSAMAPRYLTVPLMNWAVTILLYFWFAGYEKRRNDFILALGAICAGLLAIALPRTSHWLESESNSFAEYQMAELSLQDGLMDKHLLLRIFPSVEFLKEYIPELQESKLSIYFKWRGRWLGRNVTDYAPIAPVQAPGQISLTYPVNSGVEVIGWADESNTHRSYHWIILANQRGQIIGFGRKLPAGFPDSLPTSKTPPSLGWVGFVNLHYPSQTISAYLADDRKSELIPIGTAAGLPNTEAANLRQTGASLAGLTWSGDTNWASGRLPLEIAGDKPNGAIYSSWYGTDGNTGRWTSSAFDTPSNTCLILPVVHGPRVPGLSVTLMDADSNQSVAVAPMEDNDTIWNFWRIPIPVGTKHLRIQAADEGVDWGEWVAIANPARCK